MSAQTIFRNAYRHKPYSQLGNAMLQDERLSPEAVTILVYVLSLPPNWRFRLENIAQKRRLGRDRARIAVKELAELGYAKKRQTRRADGKMGPYEYVFTDEPGKFEEAPPQPDLQAPVRTETKVPPQTENPAPVVQATTKKISPTKKHIQNKQSEDAATTQIISQATRTQIELMGVDPDGVIDRMKKSKRPIHNLNAYALASAKSEASERLGVSEAVVGRMASSDMKTRAQAMVAAVVASASPKPHTARPSAALLASLGRASA